MKPLALVGLVLTCVAGVWWFQRSAPESSPALQADPAVVEDESSGVVNQNPVAPTESVERTDAANITREETQEALPGPPPYDAPTFQVRVTSATRGYSFGNAKRESVVYPNVKYKIGARVFGGSPSTCMQGKRVTMEPSSSCCRGKPSNRSRATRKRGCGEL